MIRYHTFADEPSAQRKLQALQAAGARAYLLTMNSSHHEVREFTIGDTAWSLEPMTTAPASTGHVTLDARNVDAWSRNNGR